MKKNIAVKPSTTRYNQTGSWRVQRPEVNHELCIGCATCEKYCPEGCIFATKDPMLQGKVVYEKDLDYCKGCGICAAVCPVKCIKMVAEEK